MSKQPRATDILRPYQTFDSTPIIEEFELDHDYKPQSFRSVIMLSGPPGSGKTSQMRSLLESKFGDTAQTLVPSSLLYAMMRVCGLPETHLSYESFKLLPLGRERLIAASNRFRSYETDIYGKATLSRVKPDRNKIVIIDNVGFQDEIDFYGRLAVDPLLIELQLPFAILPQSQLARPYLDATLTGGRWTHDSRFSLAKYATETLGTRNSIAFINSSAAKTLLDRYIFNRASPMSSGLAGTAFGNLHRVWRDAVETGVIGDLFDHKG